MNYNFRNVNWKELLIVFELLGETVVTKPINYNFCKTGQAMLDEPIYF